MSISAPFIRRPIGTSLLAAALLMSGILAFTFLPVASLPRVDFPVIGVGAGLPGADPPTMASSVATPLERQLGESPRSMRRAASFPPICRVIRRTAK